ncbi:hypothetical protein IAU59_000245 [Kwoniella sp. CBS 9459]
MVPTSLTPFLLTFLSLPFTLANSLSGLSLVQPLSQQFPPVARVDRPFSWTFSSNTFAASGVDLDDLSYTAFNLPSWLAFSGSTRTFTGCPTADDVGNRVVQLTATSSDGQSTISDHVVLSVSDKSGNITLLHPIADQLNDPDSGSITSAYPYPSTSPHYPGVRVPPNWSFSLGFTPSTFAAPSRVFYSASMKDGSALPGWLGFNNQTVTFDGVTPPVTGGSTFEVVLSGSDVWGFSDIQDSFSIVVATHDLQVVTQPVVNMTMGYNTDMSLKNLVRQSLSLDGEDGKVDMSDLTGIELDTSSISWLRYYTDNISITGVPPTSQTIATELPLRITDDYGDSLNTTLQLAFFPSVFNTERPDSINLEINKQSSIDLDQYFTGTSTSRNPTNLTASFDPKEASSWLSLSSDQKALAGTPPNDVKYDQVTVALRAQDLVTNAYSRSILTVALRSNGTTLEHTRPARMNGLGKGTKVALGIVCSLVAVLIILFALLAIRRRRSTPIRREVEEAPEGDGEGKWSYEAAETPALEYTEKMGDPATAQMLVLGRVDGGSSETVVAPVPHLRMGSGGSTTSRLKQSIMFNPFNKGNKKVFPKISNPIIMPSLSNAAFQAQLAAAVDSAGIVNRGNSTYSAHSELTQTSADDSADFTATPSFVSDSQIDRSQAGSKASQRSSMTGGARTTITDDSAFGPGQSSRASWESEPPFVWTIADTPHEAHTSREGSLRSASSPSSSTHESRGGSMRQRDSNAPVQRADFKITNIPMPSSRAPSPHGSMATADLTDEGISIDNIHFPTDSDLAHTEASSNSNSKDDLHAVAIIQTASRVDARRTLDSPATASLASSHTERGTPSPVMTTHSRLVSFGKHRQVEVEEGRGKGSTSHSAVVEAGSGSIGLGIMGTPPHQRAVATPSPPPESPLPQPPRAVTRPRAPVPPSRSPTPPSSLPSLPALPTLPLGTSTASRKTRTRATSPLASPQRILLGVSEPFHFYPPLSISPSTSTSSTSSASTGGKIARSGGAEYLAFVEKKVTSSRDIRLGLLPSWLHFEDGELWGVPTEDDRGEVDLRIVERRGGDERVVGRFSLEVS